MVQYPLVACMHCAHVARKDSFSGARRQCPQCLATMQPVSLAYARILVRRRRNADARRSTEAAATDIGLKPLGSELAA
jgi:hypothetical protein